MSSSITLARDELDGAIEIRKSMQKSKDGNEDLSEPHEETNEFGVYDPASNTVRRDTFSNLAKADRLSKATGDAAKELTEKYPLDSEFVRAFAQENNIDLAKFSPSHRELYQTILFHQVKTAATDNPRTFNDAGVQKLSKRILTNLNTLDAAQAQESIQRLAELREVGKTLFASISNDEIKGLTERRQALAQALISYVEKANSNKILHDLVSRKPGEPVGGDDLGLAKIAIADIAFSGIKPANPELLLKDALKEDSQLRAAYRAVGAHDKNPAVNNNNALNAAVLELILVLNLVVQQIGINSGLGNATIGDAVRQLPETFSEAKFEEFSASSQNASTVGANTVTQEIFDVLTPYLN